MSRPKNPTATAPTDTLNHEALAADSAALTVLGTRSAEIAQRFGDGQPYERARVISEARFFMAASAEAMFELGKRLIVIKENEPKGDFMEIVEQRLGIPYRTAFRFMAVSVKLAGMPASNLPTLASLGKSKLFDLLDEPAEDVEALVDGGKVADLDLDDMQRMSARELRAALVESRKKAAAKDAVIAKKDQKLNELTEAEERRRSGSASEREQAQLDDLRAVTLACEQSLLALLASVDDAIANAATEAASMAARQTLDYVVQRLADGALERGLALNLDERVMPLQMKAIREVVEAGLKASRNKTGH